MRKLKKNIWPHVVSIKEPKDKKPDEWCKDHVGIRFKDWYSYSPTIGVREYAFKDTETMLVFKLNGDTNNMLELIRSAFKDLLSWILADPPEKEDNYSDVKSANVPYPRSLSGSVSKRAIQSSSSPSSLDEYNYGINFTVFGAR